MKEIPQCEDCIFSKKDECYLDEAEPVKCQEINPDNDCPGFVELKFYERIIKLLKV